MGLRSFCLRRGRCEHSGTLRTQVRKFLLQAGPNFRIEVRSEKITSVLCILAAAVLLLESLAHVGAQWRDQPTNAKTETSSHLKSSSTRQVHSIYTVQEPASTVSTPTKLSCKADYPAAQPPASLPELPPRVMYSAYPRRAGRCWHRSSSSSKPEPSSLHSFPISGNGSGRIRRLQSLKTNHGQSLLRW